jgi:hypothetical protein
MSLLNINTVNFAKFSLYRDTIHLCLWLNALLIRWPSKNVCFARKNVPEDLELMIEIAALFLANVVQLFVVVNLILSHKVRITLKRFFTTFNVVLLLVRLLIHFVTALSVAYFFCASIRDRFPCITQLLGYTMQLYIIFAEYQEHKYD